MKVIRFETYNDMLRHLANKEPHQCPHATARLRMDQGRMYHMEMDSSRLRRLTKENDNE